MALETLVGGMMANVSTQLCVRAKRATFAGVVSILLVATTGMTSSSAETATTHAARFKPITVNVGENPATFTNQALYELAQAQGFFKKYGIKANLVPVSASAAPEALASGAI